MKELVFYHAADFHLGAALNRFPTAVSQKIIEAQFDALCQFLSMAVDDQAAFVLICGDLFDDLKPSNAFIEKTIRIFSQFSSTKIIILPGTHDYLSAKSIYARWSELCPLPNMVVLNEELSRPYFLQNENVFLYYNLNQANRSRYSPIDGFSRTTRDGFHVGLAHGSLGAKNSTIARDYYIDPRDVEKSKLDYLALGHWHKFRIETIGQTIVTYPGIPQPLSFSDPAHGYVARVALKSGSQPIVKKIRTSSIAFIKIAEKVYHPADILMAINGLDKGSSILKMTLSYSDKFKEWPEAGRILKEISERFLFMVNPDDFTSDPFSPRSTPSFEPGNEKLADIFVRELERLKEADLDDNRVLYERAKELGLKLIRGDE